MSEAIHGFTWSCKASRVDSRIAWAEQRDGCTMWDRENPERWITCEHTVEATP